jgi:hypothetical protein
MKKTIALIVLLSCAGPAFAGDRILLLVGWNFLRNADPFYRATYGPSASFPEIAIAGRFSGDLYVMAGYGTVTKHATVPDLETEATSKQNYLWAGLGYLPTLYGPLKAKIEAGLADLMYSEEGLGLKAAGSKIGYQVQAGLLVMVKSVFAGIDIGYFAASGKVGELKIKLGGTRIALSAGFRM